MKLTVNQGVLAKALSIVNRAVSGKSTLPILSDVLLETENGRLKLSATNLEISIVTCIDAQVEEDGAISVPAQLLTGYVMSLPNVMIAMNLQGENRTLKLSCQGSRSQMKGSSLGEFPEIPTIEDGMMRIMLEPQVVRDVINLVAVAANPKDARMSISGVAMIFSGDGIVFVATDGFRLSEKILNCPTGVVEPFTILVPIKTLQDVAKICSEREESVEIVVTENQSQALFHCGDTDLVSRLIEGEYPNYSRLIPSAHSTTTIVNADDFLAAVKRSALFTDQMSNVVTIALNGKMSVSTGGTQVGESENDVEAEISGGEMKITLNAEYLINCLSALSGNGVVLETAAKDKAAVFKISGEDKFLHLIMPISPRS